jgi:predicted transcriptional regulator of viral defense system
MEDIMESGFIKPILKSTQTVFSTRDFQLFWEDVPLSTVKNRISYYIRRGDLYPIRRGLYAKDDQYDRLEMATRIYTPAYISFETVLGKAGITFQHYSQIFVASPQTKEIEADGQKISFLTLKGTILMNSLGLEDKRWYVIATPERAFLDRVYLTPDYHFDNLDLINWDKVNEILPAYGGNKQMKRRVEAYRNSRGQQ